MSAHRVLVVEDNEATATFVCQQLAAGGLVPETVRGGLEALRRAHNQAFALAIVDVDIASEPDGVETADWLRRLYGVPVVVFSVRNEAESSQRAVGAGPAAIVNHPMEPGELSSLVSRVLARRPWLDLVSEGGLFRTSTPRMELPGGPIAERRPPAPPAVAMPAGFAELSGREWQIIRDLIETPSAHAIARKRQRSPHTVHNHLKSIFKKLRVHSVAELLSLMIRLDRQPL